MRAIVLSGGKQYTVKKDDIVEVELLDAKEGDNVKLQVLMIVDGDKSGYGVEVKHASVTAEVLSHGRGEKINIFTYKAKKNIRKRKGHRQPFTRLKITAIEA